MKNVLIVSGHTDLNDSVANKIVLEELKKALPNAEFDILSEEYPTFKIDVAAEQAKLVKADVIVWEFPVFWYSMPSILQDRKSTRLNSSHANISYAVFCLKKKKNIICK